MAQQSQSISRMPASFDIHNVIERIKGVLTFRRTTVTSIAADRGATLEAGIVVATVGLASAIGLREDAVTMLVATLVGWAGLTAAVWFFAEHVLSTPTSHESFQPLLRTIGYAQAPAALVIVHFIWGLGPMIGLIGFVWSFTATIYAILRTTHFGLPRSTALTIAGGIMVNVVGFIISIITGIDPQIW